MTLTVINYNNEQMGTIKSDHIKWLITLTMITLSSFHCTMIFLSLVHFSREFSTSRVSREVSFLTRNENETRSRSWLVISHPIVSETSILCANDEKE